MVPHMGVLSLYHSKGKKSAALAHNVQLLCQPLCYLQVTLMAVLHIHQQSAVFFFFFFYSWQRAIFMLLKHDVQEQCGNKGGWCMLILYEQELKCIFSFASGWNYLKLWRTVKTKLIQSLHAIAAAHKFDRWSKPLNLMVYSCCDI